MGGHLEWVYAALALADAVRGRGADGHFDARIMRQISAACALWAAQRACDAWTSPGGVQAIPDGAARAGFADVLLHAARADALHAFGQSQDARLAAVPVPLPLRDALTFADLCGCLRPSDYWALALPHGGHGVEDTAVRRVYDATRYWGDWAGARDAADAAAVVAIARYRVRDARQRRAAGRPGG